MSRNLITLHITFFDGENEYMRSLVHDNNWPQPTNQELLEKEKMNRGPGENNDKLVVVSISEGM